MSIASLVNHSGEAVSDTLIETFRSAHHGPLIRPADADYDTARRIWNASINRRPGMIVRCTGLADVIAAVNFAREHRLLVAVRGGGHNVGGRALCDGGMVIDLTRMKGIHVDAAAKRARVQPGVLLGELDRETHVYGMAVPAGVVSNTGIAGLTLGGGVGWLARKYGLSCDNVLSFEVVTADGKVRRASADEHPDLFWALRGGGGNFGVVTSFEFQLRPVSTVLGGMLVHPRERALDLLKFYRDFTRDAPDELATYYGLIHTPDGAPVTAIVTCYNGDLSAGEKVLAPLRRFGPPMMDAVAPIPFPQMQTLIDGAVPDGNQNYWKSAFLKDLNDSALETIVRYANEATSPMTAVLVEQYGGAAGRVGPQETAFGQRHVQYDLGILSQWADPKDSDRHIAWTRAFAAAMVPHGAGGYFLNFLGADEEDGTIRAAFGGNYDRLVEVKTKYDPDNFFRVNQNVEPKRGQAGS
jgi:hypothetical protein